MPRCLKHRHSIIVKLKNLLTRNPQIVYYGYVRKAKLGKNEAEAEIHGNSKRRMKHG